MLVPDALVDLLIYVLGYAFVASFYLKSLRTAHNRYQCEQVLCGLAVVLRNATYIKRVDGSGGRGRGGGRRGVGGLGVWQAGARKNRSDGVVAEKASWWLYYVMFYHLEIAAVNASWFHK